MSSATGLDQRPEACDGPRQPGWSGVLQREPPYTCSLASDRIGLTLDSGRVVSESLENARGRRARVRLPIAYWGIGG